jgi:hypothetical protein
LGRLVTFAGWFASLSLVAPFILTRNAWYEWANYYWLILQQEMAVRAHFLPSYFVQNPTIGFFYPIFLFNGGPIYWLAACLALVLGSAWAAFVVMLLLASTAAYFGLWWIGRLAGLSRTIAAIPALFVTTSAYAVTDLYGNGDWAEMMVAGFAPLAAATAISAIRSSAHRKAKLGLLLLSVFIVSGSDNAAFLCVVIFVLIMLLALSPAIWSRREQLPWRPVLLVSAVAVAGVAINSWYLFPGASYSHDTELYGRLLSLIQRSFVPAVDRLAVTLNPLRFNPIPRSNANFYPQLTVGALAFGTAAAVFSIRRRGPERRATIGLAVVISLLLVVLSSSAVWKALPRQIRLVQFPTRFDIVTIFAIAALVILSLRVVHREARAPRAWAIGCGLLALVALGLAEGQAWTAHALEWKGHSMAVSASRLPYPWQLSQSTGFRFLRTNNLYRPRSGDGYVFALPTTMRDGTVALTITPQVEVASANIVWSPLVSAKGGATIAGRDRNGNMILRRLGKSDLSTPARVTVESTLPPIARVGQIASVFALLVAFLLIVLERRAKERDVGRPNPVASPHGVGSGRWVKRRPARMSANRSTGPPVASTSPE